VRGLRSLIKPLASRPRKNLPNCPKFSLVLECPQHQILCPTPLQKTPILSPEIDKSPTKAKRANEDKGRGIEG